MRNLLLLFAITFCTPFLLSPVQSREARRKADAPPDAIPTISFCAFFQNPQLYKQRVVRTKAIFRRAREDSMSLECLDCPGPKAMRVRFDESFDSRTKPSVLKKFDVSPDITLSVVLVGKFDYSTDKAGELVGFNFLMMAAERAEVLSRTGQSPSKLPRRTKQRIRCSSIARTRF